MSRANPWCPTHRAWLRKCEHLHMTYLGTIDRIPWWQQWFAPFLLVIGLTAIAAVATWFLLHW